jgi:hypothetical protein
MPRRELKSGKQVADWLAEIGSQSKLPGNMTLIGPAALLGHTHERGLTPELPEAGKDVDPVMTMAYHELPPDVLENAPELTSWSRRAIQVAAAKPKKSSRRMTKLKNNFSLRQRLPRASVLDTLL